MVISPQESVELGRCAGREASCQEIQGGGDMGWGVSFGMYHSQHLLGRGDDGCRAQRGDFAGSRQSTEAAASGCGVFRGRRCLFVGFHDLSCFLRA